MKRSRVVVAALVVVVTLVGPAGPSWAQPKKEIVDSFRAGKDVLEKKCKLCHVKEKNGDQ